MAESASAHDHVFLGEDHAASERKTWAVIWLCAAAMIVEIVGGLAFGSLALVADGLHMSTHAGAFLLAALAYRFARVYADDERFCFGTGKLGDLAGFASAIALGMVSLGIGWEALERLFAPVPIRFAQAVPIAIFGLAVNVASAWLLSGAHPHGHAHDHPHDHGHDHGVLRDNNMRAAVVHVFADAAVSVLVLAGLALAWAFGWLFMDPLAGLVGAAVIASWSWTLIRDAGAVLVDMNPDREMTRKIRLALEDEGDRLEDLHLWRLGPGHLGAIACVATREPRGPEFYRAKLARFPTLSHVTVEVKTAR